MVQDMPEAGIAQASPGQGRGRRGEPRPRLRAPHGDPTLCRGRGRRSTRGARPCSCSWDDAMKSVSYEVFARSGIPGDTERGTVAELLLDIPYLLALRIIPPLAVINEV